MTATFLDDRHMLRYCPIVEGKRKSFGLDRVLGSQLKLQKTAKYILCMWPWCVGGESLERPVSCRLLCRGSMICVSLTVLDNTDPEPSIAVDITHGCIGTETRENNSSGCCPAFSYWAPSIQTHTPCACLGNGSVWRQTTLNSLSCYLFLGCSGRSLAEFLQTKFCCCRSSRPTVFTSSCPLASRRVNSASLLFLSLFVNQNLNTESGNSATWTLM